MDDTVSSPSAVELKYFEIDELAKADSFVSTKLSEPVKIRLDDNNFKPATIYSVFKNTVCKHGNKYALIGSLNNKKYNYTYQEYWDLTMKCAKSFIKLGLQPHTSVAIIGFNAYPWIVSLYGSIFAGGVACGVYTTNSVEICKYILKDSYTEIVVVENNEILKKILACREECKIKKIIQYSGEIENSYNGLVIKWDDFMEYGTSISENDLYERLSLLAPNKCATLIYTSGTTGNPKAVMLSHDNLTFTAYSLAKLLNIKTEQQRIISYLPLSHIAAQIIDCFTSVIIAAQLHFAQPDALKGTLVNTLTSVRPTLFFGVPRVWEKMQEKIESVVNSQSKLKKRIFTWAMKKGNLYIHSKFDNKSPNNFTYKVANALVLKKVRATLGLSECQFNVYSGAAPISRKTLDFFAGLGFPLCEVFGMSECTGPHSGGFMGANKIGSVGQCQDWFNQTKIADQDKDGNGELCLKGRHVSMGYLNNPEKTKETIDDDGWLHTGDVARIDKDKFIFITGRIKELIITAGGENVAPVPIEENIKEELSNLVSNCMLIGDKRKFLTVLITLRSQMNMETLESLDELTDDCKNWLKTIGSNSRTVSEVLATKDKVVYDTIEKGIKRANQKTTSRAAVVQKFTIVPRDFTIPGGELGPTLKLKRQVVVAKYNEEIEELYKGDE